MLKLRAAVTLVLLLGACTASREPKQPAEPRNDTAAVTQAATTFLAAFDSLNWDSFVAHLSDSVDGYWPRPDTAERLRNRAAVEARFKALFAQLRATRPGPPYLHLKISDFGVRIFQDVGLVTFELADVPDTIGRRTLVFHRDPAGWRIVHLHASNLPLSR
jgi:SnoaL-like protein